MRIEETPLAGVFVIELDRIEDDRGWFARIFCREELAEAGIEMEVAQANASLNHQTGTLRGLHYQADPHGERKLVRCTRGGVFDVAVDVREGAETRGKWFGTELSADNGRMLYVPEGFAHGFQSLVDETEVSYLVSHPYTPDSERGVRWDDPAIGIEWPLEARVISERDKALPPLDP